MHARQSTGNVAPPRLAGLPAVTRGAGPCGGGCARCAGVAPPPRADPHEREADRVADAVMRRPDPTPGERNRSPQPGGLDTADRAFLEPRPGRDLGGVRIHADAGAPRAARALGARAFTQGNDVWFAEGRYRPGTARGRRLLAHELTHLAQQGTAPPLAGHGGFRVQRTLDVGFDVASPTAAADGELGDPNQDHPGTVTWPLDFGLTAPLDASARVDVTGAAGDDCTAFEAGVLQAVRANELETVYTGASPGHGTTTVSWTVDLPIRDGHPASMWYEPASNATASACNTRLTPTIGDYPTIQRLPKRRTNSRTSRPNHLRSIGFVTTPVASGGGSVQPRRLFPWAHNMAITFTADPANVNDAWPFQWLTNATRVLAHHAGTSSSGPLFTTASDTYNAQLAENVNETG